MSDRNSPPPFEGGGTTPRTPSFDRDSPSYNPTPNEELVTPPLPTTVPRDRLKEQSMEFSRMLVYRPTKEQLTEKVNDAVKKITDVKPSKTKLKLKVNRITVSLDFI
uniref:Uncharacterized protein n=1 Tax=Panagrolaimus davidi TaxID=227884 RepID=A0A914PVR9_9BILA